MNKAFRIVRERARERASELVELTIEYHRAVKGGDELEIKRAYRKLVDTQNYLSAICENLADEAVEAA